MFLDVGARVNIPLKQLAFACCATVRPMVPFKAPIGVRKIYKGALYMHFYGYKGNYFNCDSCLSFYLNQTNIKDPHSRLMGPQA